MTTDNEKPGGVIGALWDTMIGFFTAMFVSVWAGFTDIIPHVIEGFRSQIPLLHSKHEEPTWQSMLDRFKERGIIDEAGAEALLQMKEATNPWDEFFYIYLLASLSMTYVKQGSYAAGGKTRQALNTLYAPEVPHPREVIMAAFVAPEKTGQVRDSMKRAGYNDDDIDLMFLASYRLYTEMDVRNLWLRGVLTDDQMFMRMRELGYTDTRIKEVIQGWTIIPGPMDLFTMVAHEAFEPDAIELMGLADEFPEDQVAWLTKQGVSREWALRYWYSHWDQPSIGMGYEMLHRGVIDLDTLDMLYRTVEIPPFWRDKLTKIAYNPYTRVDVRRMHKLGIIDDEELIKSYMDLGYDREHATGMMKFTVEYNQGADKELTKAQILTGYNDKLMTREDAATLIQELKYSPDQTEYLLTLEDYREAKDIQDDLITNIQGRFVNNYMTEFEARDKLGQLNLAALKIDAMIERWKVKVFANQKLPSKTDLDKLYRNDIINEETWRDEMRKLGYGHIYAGWYFDLLKIKSPAK